VNKAAASAICKVHFTSRLFSITNNC